MAAIFPCLFIASWDIEADMQGNWRPAGGNGWENAVTDLATSITAVELQGDDPEALAARWTAVAGVDVETRGGTPKASGSNATSDRKPPRLA